MQDTRRLPEGWELVTLGEVAAIRMGQSPPSKTYNKEKKGLPFYQGKTDFGELFPSPRIWCYEPRAMANENDILISVRAPVGPTNLAKEKCCIGRGLASISPLDGVDTWYVLQYLRLMEEELAGMGSGSTFTAISRNHLDTLAFPLPPTNEQKRIVLKIKELFNESKSAIQSLERILSSMKKLRYAILLSAFKGELVPMHSRGESIQNTLAKFRNENDKDRRSKKGHLKNDVYNALEQVDVESVRHLPKGWMWVSLGQITESMKNGVYKPPQFYTEKGVACLRMYNIENGTIVWKDIKRMELTKEEIQEYKLVPGDILVNRVNSRELVGKAAVIPEGLETCVFESKNIRLRLLNNIALSEFVSYWFQIFGQQYFDRNAQQTVGMASINQGQLASMPIPLASIVEQKAIVARVKELFVLANNLEKSAKIAKTNTEKIDPLVLLRAFRGELTPQDVNDEPASALLVKIKSQRK